MPDIRVLREEMERVKTRAQAILDAHKDGLTQEQDLELGVLIKAAQEKQAEIEREAKLVAKAAELANLDKFLSEPVGRLPHGINGDDDDRKGLLKAGWEIKTGMVYAPTSLGKSVEMFGEAVLFGPIPEDDPAAAVFYKTTRAAMAPEYKAAYQRYIRNIARYGDGMAHSMLNPSEQKALSEGTDTTGGFLVPPDIQAEVLVRVAQKAVVRQFARV